MNYQSECVALASDVGEHPMASFEFIVSFSCVTGEKGEDDVRREVLSNEPVVGHFLQPAPSRWSSFLSSIPLQKVTEVGGAADRMIRLTGSGTLPASGLPSVEKAPSLRGTGGCERLTIGYSSHQRIPRSRGVPSPQVVASVKRRGGTGRPRTSFATVLSSPGRLFFDGGALRL